MYAFQVAFGTHAFCTDSQALSGGSFSVITRWRNTIDEARRFIWQWTQTLRLSSAFITRVNASKSAAVGLSQTIGMLTNTRPWRPTIFGSSAIASPTVGGAR